MAFDLKAFVNSDADQHQRADCFFHNVVIAAGGHLRHRRRNRHVSRRRALNARRLPRRSQPQRRPRQVGRLAQRRCRPAHVRRGNHHRFCDIIKGIPIITPDAIVSPDITIPSQDDWIEKFSDNSVPMDWNNLDVSLPNFENVSIDSKNTTSGEFTIVEQMPEVIHRVKPEYPSLPRQAGIEGRVYVKGLVNEEGMVTRTVFASGDEIFYNAASETFLKTRFKPGINGGVAVKVWVMMPFTFRLR